MLRDLTGQKKVDPQTVIAAIKSLQQKGWEVNPHTVADEAKIPRSAVYRNAELMELINRARNEAAGEPAAADLSARVKELEKRNAQLEEQLRHLEAEYQSLAASSQDAWQQGYQAGLAEGRAEAASASPGEQTSAGFYAHAGDKEAVAGMPADKPESPAAGQAEAAEAAESYAVPEIDFSAPASEGEYVSQEWLEQQGAAAGAHEEPAAYEQAGGCDQDEEPSQYEGYFTRAAQGQTEADAGEYGEAAEQWQEYSQFAQAGEAADDEAFQEAEQQWRSGLEDGAAPYDPTAQFEGGEAVEQEGGSDTKTPPISEEELRDLLKYRFGRSQPEQAKDVEAEKKLAGTKFVGGARPTQELPKRDFVVRNVPPDIRKACLVLGLRPEELTRETVHKAWKKEMANPGTHPDVGGDTEIAVYINTAKDTLMRWLDAQAPKLGKQFGKSAREPARSSEPPAAQGGAQGERHAERPEQEPDAT
ncbi:MAG TPA: hypothetical protein V6D08_01050 [Candidatus Obscuribacterales bacterium]